MTSPAVIAVDVGGTTVKAALVAPGAEPIVVRSRTNAHLGPDAALATVLSSFDRLAAEAERRSLVVVAAAVATLGVVDERDGIVVTSTIGWKDLALGDAVAGRLGVPVRVVNDVRAGARAEAERGAGRGCRTFAFAAVGTGLSVSVVADGVVLTGSGWAAGEVGQPVLGRGGSVESRASATAIERDHAATTGAAVPTLVATEVLRRARAGDGPAGQVRDRALGALAEALGWVVTVADPDPIVLGGGLGEAGDDLLVPLAEALRRAVDWRPPPTLVAAAFGERAGWVGAALHGWELAGLDPDDLVVARAR